MKLEAIAALPASRELDALIAEKVMGIRPELIKTTKEPWRYVLGC